MREPRKLLSEILSRENIETLAPRASGGARLEHLPSRKFRRAILDPPNPNLIQTRKCVRALAFWHCVMRI